ncbi:ysgA [Symbiodinium necroappetens]|uniref:YsgA protein n=1 Tax=Symbiodinium necroappetens TaxID=1628268 RepID=A0A813BYT1_9DINO|nr:ysgA [Symbiodinium necroappetens]
MGPSLGHFDTHETVSYMLFHENNKAAVDPSLGMQIEVNVTAASAEAAASFAELCNSLVQKLNTGPFLEVHSYGSLVTILSMPLPGGTAADGLRSLVPIMKHIGHLTFNVSANNNIEHMMAHPDDSIWKQAKTGAKFMLDATLTNAVEKALVDRLNASSGHDEVECPTMEAPCLDTDHPGSCCSLRACVAPDDGEESGPNWQEIQCKYNQTCAPLCGGSAVAKTPRDYALAMSEKLMQIFTGGSLDVRVAYDDEIVKGIFASLPVLNMTFRSLQEQYRSLAQQNHLEKFASHPFAAAGVEVMNAVNKDLVSIESVELKNLPSDIRLVIKLENAKPFQFIFALLEGSGILGMLAGMKAAPPVWEFEAGTGWKPFGDDCQDEVEKLYQSFCSGGSRRIEVKTQGMSVSLDFQKMTSLAADLLGLLLMDSGPFCIWSITGAEDARLQAFRGLKHRKLPADIVLAEGYDAVLLLLTSQHSCKEVLLQPHMESEVNRVLQGRPADVGRAGPSSILSSSIEVIEEVTEIRLGAGRAKLAFALADRRRAPASLHSVLPGLAVSSAPLRLIILDGLTDAANVGTLFKVAAAFGLSGVLCSPGCCDPFSARAVRVSGGQVFSMPCYQGDLPEALHHLRAEGVLTLAAVVQEGAVYFDEVQELPRRWAMVLGSEHFGVETAVREACDKLVKIRMASGVDSLNVVISGGVLVHGCVERESRE